jgi:hypothetical protein
MQGSMAEMVGAFAPRVGLSNIVCSDVPQDEVRFRIGGCDCCGTSTFLVMGGVEMTFSVVEGRPVLPFRPEGLGTPFGQGARGTRGIFAVLGGARKYRVLSRELVSALDIAERRRIGGAT